MERYFNDPTKQTEIGNFKISDISISPEMAEMHRIKFPEKGLEIPIRYVDSDVPRLKLIDKGDWIDVYAWEDVDMKFGDLKIIKLGFAMELPEGYEAHVAPRSSTAKKFGILCANSFGIIDNSYAGDDDIWGFVAYAIRDTQIHKGDRIAQFRIIEKQPPVKFVEVDHLKKENRGGFGSTGNGVL